MRFKYFGIYAAFFLVASCMFFWSDIRPLLGAASPVFSPPFSPAPDDGQLNSVDEITGYLKKDVATQVQSLGGPLTVGTSTPATAWFSGTTYDASIVGVAGDAAPVSAPKLAGLGITNAVVYGYTGGSNGGAGVEGVARAGAASSGAGIQGVVTGEKGEAARFEGRVYIRGDLFVEDGMSAPALSAASADSAIPAVTATGGLSVAVPLANVVYGEAAGGGAAVYGVYGQSASALSDPVLSSGIYGVHSVSFAGTGGSLYGMRAQSLGIATGIGVYGLAASGNGVAGIVPPTSHNYCVEAYVTGASGNALQASGGAFAALFEGDMELAAGSTLFIGSKGIGEENLRELLQWCNSGATNFCPDAYE